MPRPDPSDASPTVGTAQGALFHAPEPIIAPGTLFARVAVERGIDADRAAEGLTYRIDPAQAVPPPLVGERVDVPLGKSGKPTPGIIISHGGPELLGNLSPAKVKCILRRSGAGLSPPLMELAQWMATYYVCPLGMVLASMIPAAVKHETGRRTVELIRLFPGEIPPLKSPQQRLMDDIRALPSDTFPLSLRNLAQHLNLKGLQRLRRLIELGALESTFIEEVHARDIITDTGRDAGPALTLTPQQHAAVEGVSATFSSFHAHLLRGITASGKTEVYLRLIARVLDAGQSAIVLVPEIALTPQTATRFTQRFGPQRVAVMHSGLTPAQRHREWAKAAGRTGVVVVGARSAIFAPVRRLGLIVVDEEHDTSYKQDRLPRYNARDVAIKRAHIEQCPVLLGSATPSMESWSNANPANPALTPSRWTLWELTSRVGAARLPEVEVVDLREERRKRIQTQGRDDGRLHLLGPTLEAALADTLDCGRQAILLLNRRGFAHYISCPRPACGFVLRCDQCDSNLILHRHQGVPAGELVRCHHCLSEQLVPRLCPACATKLNVFGGGTQRALDELVRKFTAMGLTEGDTLLRLDSDSMRSARDYHRALSRFGRGEARVLVGTQMIAKGLDYPNVSLVGVLDADTALYLPDFRAEERTFQLVSQVAGRAGRGSTPGRVIVQTMNPGNPAIQLAAAHDFTGFAARELTTRRRAGLPPASRMARIVCRDEVESKARQRATDLVDLLRFHAGEAAIIRGPAPCPISRIAGQYRYALEVFAPRAGGVQAVLAAARQKGLLKSDARTAVDVDPVALL